MNMRWSATAMLLLLGLVGSAFALPADAMAQVEKTQKGWLGVQIQDITKELKKSMDLKSWEGALVSDVVEKSPADSAGIQERDIIIQFDGKTIEDSGDLSKAVGETKPGKKVSVVVLRKGEKKTLQVTIGKWTPKRIFEVVAPHAPLRIMSFRSRFNVQGLVLTELNEQLSRYFEVPDGEGVLVWEVEKNSAADKAGLKAGDVITQVGKKRVDEMRDVFRALDAFDEGEKVDVEIVRKGARKTLTIEVEENEDSHGFDMWLDGPKRLPRFRGFEFNDMPDVRLDLPHIELDRIGPDLEILRLEMDRMKDQIRDETGRLKRELRLQIKPHVQIRMRGEV